MILNPLAFLFQGRLSRLAEVEEKWEEKKKVLADELEKTEKLLASAYDRSAQLVLV